MSRSSYILVFFLFFGLNCLKAQEVSLDSTYVNQEISSALAVQDSSIAFERMEKALLIARSINYQNGKAEVSHWLANYYRKKGDNISALRYSLELLENINKGIKAELKEQTLFDIASIYQTEKLNDKALEYYRLVLPITNNKIGIWQQMGEAFSVENKLDSATFYLSKVYESAKKQDNFPTTLKALQQRAKVFEKANSLEKVLQDDLKILALVQQQKKQTLVPTCYNNLGFIHSKMKDYKKAIEYFEQAEKSNKESNVLDQSILYTNLGIAHQNIGDLKKAIQYLRRARSFLQKEQENFRFAQLTHLISTLYYKNDDTYNALIFNDEALLTAKQSSNNSALSDSYNLGASIHQDLYDYEKALDYYKKHLALRDSFLLEERLRQQSLLQQQYLLERAEKEIKILISNQEIKDLSINQLNLEKEKLELSSISLKLEAEKRESELTLLRKEQEIQDAAIKNKELEALQTQQQLRLTAQQLEAEKQEREIAELNRKEIEQRLALAEKAAEEEERLKEISLLNKDKELLTRQQEINQLELERQSTFRQFAYGLGILSLIILGLVLAGLLFARRSNNKLTKQNTEIEQQKVELEKNQQLIQEEKAKSDALLLNILPSETAEELKNIGYATPRKYDLVSVLFTDFSGFTAISKNMSAEELIGELNECFLAFDEIVERYGLEKIKTIGDAYMCAGGIPTPNTSNPIDIAHAALEMQAYMNQRIAQKQQGNQKYWNMRIGIHTGTVIAGVVGSKKFAYDIWGDTVNIASRMESNSDIGAINISATTYSYIKNHFNFTSRGPIPVKNAGEIEMFFLNDKR